MTKRILTAALVAALLGPVASASADSISFIRSGDVWVASSDGAKQVQITHDGGYSYASRADDGSFIALHGRRLHRLSATGTLLADFDTPVSGEQTAPKTSYFRGPFKPEISPDGAKVAYEYWYQEYYTDPGCSGTYCTDSRVSVGIGYSHSDRQTAWDEPGLGRQSGWVDPSWIDNSTLLASYKSVRPNVDTIIDHPGDGNQTIQEWFEDTGVWYVRDGEISRRGDAAAWVTTHPVEASEQVSQDDQVTVYKMNGAAPALPEQCFSFRNSDATYSSPSFSPDGAHIAWAADPTNEDNIADIVVADIPSQAGGCQLPSEGGRLLIKDARVPDWSPAPVPAPTTSEQPKPTTTTPATGSAPAPAGGAGPGGGDAKVEIRVAGAPLRRALANGLAVTLKLPAAGAVSVEALQGRRKVAAATARAGTAGRVSVRVRFTKAARRALKRKRSVSLVLRYRFTPGSGGAQSGSTPVRLTR